LRPPQRRVPNHTFFPRAVKTAYAGRPSRTSAKPARASCAGDLVWLLAGELHDACEIVDKHEVNFVQTPAPGTLDESITTYERNAGELEKRLAKLDDDAWGRKARFLVNGTPAWEAPLGEMLWGFLFDAIHHRGQLSSYLRPMGAKVPSIYGPSGDDPGM
jgi:uncharacterized damage-inducible protein DinB